VKPLKPSTRGFVLLVAALAACTPPPRSRSGGGQPAACDPATGRTCVGDEIHACRADGQVGELVGTCSFGACSAGACVAPCEAVQNKSHVGCRYWAVDLDNAIEVDGPEVQTTGCSDYGPTNVALGDLLVCRDPATGALAGLCEADGSCADRGAADTCSLGPVCGKNAQRSPFAVVVANPDSEESVDVTMRNADGITYTVTVLPGTLVPIYPKQVGFPDQSVDGSELAPKAYLITSTRPIVAYQFNPLDDVGVFSNDASLLLPEQALDTSYYAATLPSVRPRSDSNDFSGYVTVVGVGDGDTDVEVTPTADIKAGASASQPAIAAGQSRMFTLHPFEVLNLEAATNVDLTGTRVRASRPVAAFAGHEAAALPNPFPFTGPCCLDHLEEQLFPTSTWGKHYAIARARRADHYFDYLRIVAQLPATAVHIEPQPQTNACPDLLGPGQFCDVFIEGDVEIHATQPVEVAHYLVGGGGLLPDSGDPSLAFAVPVEQFRASYAFLVPDKYAHHYVSLAAPAGEPVFLDGTDVSGIFKPFGSGDFAAGRIEVEPGPHAIRCPATCGLEVSGFGKDVSYLYAGGLNLERIVIQ
jgi:IgGFc binding protein